MLVGPEQRELLELQARFRDPAVLTRDVSRVLPDAVALRAGDSQLSRALGPLVEHSITSSVRKDPQPLADALFPVIGPAIRKAISHALAAMMESFNRSIEQRLSWRAMQWRWIAWKTGRPFAEVVLLHTLHYRVEQVFLIHAETGLVLQHVAREHATGQDADQISAMLTAIQDFVRDSFAVGAGETLEAMRVGDLTVFVERGPHAIVAGVVRGTALPRIREMFEEAVEAIHRQFGIELRSFSGDAAPFERASPILDACLVAEVRQSEAARSYRALADRGSGRAARRKRVAVLHGAGSTTVEHLRRATERRTGRGRSFERPPQRQILRRRPARSAGGRSSDASFRFRAESGSRRESMGTVPGFRCSIRLVARDGSAPASGRRHAHLP